MSFNNDLKVLKNVNKKLKNKQQLQDSQETPCRRPADKEEAIEVDANYNIKVFNSFSALSTLPLFKDS